MRHGLNWYWHRLRAMNTGELRQRVAQKLRQRADIKRLPDFASAAVGETRPGSWPVLPDANTAPAELIRAMESARRDLFEGRWRVFGHLALEIPDPPDWFRDYFARRSLPTARPGFRLNHRELPRGADIKLLWEISRWHAATRLAQTGWLLKDAAALEKALRLLRHWTKSNPPFIGWNWTSALEAGIRLLNFCWIDALASASGADAQALAALRRQVLPAHVWYVSRHRSYGSSANNHLLGELAGLLAALARWPDLERWSMTPLDELRKEFETQVLAQFAADGGNREQALHYQLFSWELCWHARNALRAVNVPVSKEVEDRLRLAADFYVTIQTPSEPWDYGDTDSATVVPLASDDTTADEEWRLWFAEPERSPALRWWLGDPPPPHDPPACARPLGDWLVFPESGQAVFWTEGWTARWDLSPLGLPPMAAHGHLDALHFSLWLGDVAIIIDPGTGAYYGDTRLRAWLASWAAHNGPHQPDAEFPRRLGPFLWETAHEVPRWRVIDDMFEAELRLPHGVARRRVRRLSAPDRDGWEIDDLFVPAAGRPDGFRVCWQFAPGVSLESEPGNPHLFRGERRGARFTAGFDAAWARVQYFPATHDSLGFPVEGDLEGLCSPAFRRLESGPRIVLTARGQNPAMYRSTFLRARD
jgi:hypothetical protein